MKKWLLPLLFVLLFCFLLTGCDAWLPGEGGEGGGEEGGGSDEPSAPTACAHDYETVEVVAHTATTHGHVTYRCKKCGASYTEDTGIVHSYTPIKVLEPTCESGGYTRYQCEVCGDIAIGSETEPHGHSFTGGKSCATRTCDECEQVIPGTHDYVLTTVKTEATLNRTGSGEYVCSACGDKVTMSIPVLDPKTTGLPVIYLKGSMSGIGKDRPVTMDFTFYWNGEEINCPVEVEYQGATSSGYAEHNYNIRFFRDNTKTKKYKLDLFGWGASSKYCFKGNYNDCSEARNTVSAWIYGDIAATRDNMFINDNPLQFAPNYGATDGEPVLIYQNGSFIGLYTAQIPKGDWMFGMEEESEESRQAVIISNAWTDTGRFYSKCSSFTTNGWGLVDCSTTDSAWVLTSLNNLIDFVNNNTGDRFKAGIDQYLDVDGAIDCMLYTYFICAVDNTSKNTCWATYDGVKWTPNVYDLDGTWGMQWTGAFSYDANKTLLPSVGSSSVNAGTSNRIWERLWQCYPDRIYTRYRELRETVLTYDHVAARFNEFFDKIPDVVYRSERERWPGIYSKDPTSDGSDPFCQKQILKFAKDRLAAMDTLFENIRIKVLK